MALEMDALLGVCRFVVNIWDNFTILIFNEYV